MKIKAALFSLGLMLVIAANAVAAPLRVFIRAGVKTHGPNQHDHPRFLADWKPLLTQRGVKADGAMTFPTADQLENTDVLVIFAADGMKIVGAERERMEKFLKRGGGLVVLHDGIVAGEEVAWSKKVQGAAWVWKDGKTKWYEGVEGLYFLDTTHPITQGVSNFDWKDEIYYNLEVDPSIHILASSFKNPFEIHPQLWTLEKTWEGGAKPYRCFVSIPGHEYDSFQTPHYRALLMRGIAWAGGLKNVDQLCSKDELASLRYPEGGPTAPAKAHEKLQVHPDFDLKLVASEPLIEKVISLDWDTQGRMWVAETPEYPNGRTINRNDNVIDPYRNEAPDKYKGDKENRPARDRISILTDSKGNGVYDRKQVFYEGLELVTSVVPYRDGVIVAQAPDILWIRDTKGRGKADKVEKLYTGFGTSDTHAVMSNLRWGMDGWVYGAVGYSAGNPVSGDGQKRFGRITAGIFRFRPDGSALQQVASGACNTWGFDFAWDGEMIYTTATCGEPICHIAMPEWAIAKAALPGVRATIPIIEENKVYPAIKNRRMNYVQIDWVNAFTAATGSCMYNGGAWPDKWNYSHFVSEATVNLTHHEFIVPNGATYQGHKEEGRKDKEFLNSTDLWFRPIHQRVGPDGALYIVDFYNQAAVHNDTRGPKHGANNAAVRPDRDHHFSRIWRIQHKQAQKLPAEKFNTKKPVELVKLLEHPNGWARMTATRLLTEGNVDDRAIAALATMAGSSTETSAARIHALHTLNNLHKLGEPLLLASAASTDTVVQKNALKIIAESDSGSGNRADAARKALGSADGRVRMNALLALQAVPFDAATAKAIVAVWPSLKQKHLESAALGVAVADPQVAIEAAFASAEPANLAPFVAAVARQLGTKQEIAGSAKLVALLARQPASLDGLKQVALEGLAASLKPENAPAWSSELETALLALVKSPNPGLAGSALPLVARWDKTGAMAPALVPAIAQMTAVLKDASRSDEDRAQVAVNLLGVRKMGGDIVGTVSSVLVSGGSESLQRKLIEALGTVPDISAAQALIKAYSRLDNQLRTPAFAQLLKRVDWSQELLKAIRSKEIELATLGPANMHRLRTHPDLNVAKAANAMIDEMRGPELKEKDTLIAQFNPAVTQPGNIDNGHKLFTANCAACHVYKNEGKDLAPSLTGMGAHGPADLLVHVLDPNRVVEPNFYAWTIETKDDTSFDGIIVRENRTIVTLRNASGDYEIRQDNIKSRRNTGLSLMPNGFEALGREGMRDLLAYICADEGKYRILDLKSAYTASSLRGLFYSLERTFETLSFSRFGLVKAGDVPFEVMNPNKSPNGLNLVVLRGGPDAAYSHTLADSVTVKVGVAASKLYFLGGVAGWGFPSVKDEGLAIAKVLVKYEDGKTEEIALKNGIEFADYNGAFDVPGSKPLAEVVRSGQIRWFAKDLKRQAKIDSLTLQSTGGPVAPVFVSITAEIAH